MQQKRAGRGRQKNREPGGPPPGSSHFLNSTHVDEASAFVVSGRRLLMLQKTTPQSPKCYSRKDRWLSVHSSLHLNPCSWRLRDAIHVTSPDSMKLGSDVAPAVQHFSWKAGQWAAPPEAGHSASRLRCFTRIDERDSNDRRKLSGLQSWLQGFKITSWETHSLAG